jgi:hypothetical protein
MKAYLCLVALSTCAIAADWLTYGHDLQRTSWALEETKIAPDSVSTMAWMIPEGFGIASGSPRGPYE